MGLKPAPLQVVLYGPRLHLYIMYIIYKLHDNYTVKHNTYCYILTWGSRNSSQQKLGPFAIKMFDVHALTLLTFDHYTCHLLQHLTLRRLMSYIYIYIWSTYS